MKEGRSALTEGTIQTRVAHTWCIEGYAGEKWMRPRQSIVVMQSADEMYGGSDENGGSGGESGRAQSGRTKTIN